MTKTYDTIIVGGGLAGLTAATELAQAGLKPLLVERNASLGGRARTDDLDGWLFNHGGHALYNEAIGHRTLQRLGIEPDGALAPLDGAQLAMGHNTTPLPLNARSLLQTKALSAAGKAQFGTLLARLPKLTLADYAHMTVDEWLAGYRTDVQDLVKAVVRLSTYAAATALMSADAAISQLVAGLNGVLYLHGGWAALCEQITRAATAAGAVISSGVTVSAVARDGDGKYSVHTDGETLHAATVIVAAGGPALTARLLHVDEAVFGDAGPAPQAAAYDLALDEMPSRHTFILGIDQPTYFSVHSPPARLAPDGKVAAVAMRYLTNTDNGTADEHRESLEHVAALAGTATPVRSRFLRRMTVAQGMPIASAGGMAGRPGIIVDGLEGAFIAGDWVGARGLLADTAIASGAEAAEAVQRHVAAALSAARA